MPTPVPAGVNNVLAQTLNEVRHDRNSVNVVAETDRIMQTITMALAAGSDG